MTTQESPHQSTQPRHTPEPTPPIRWWPAGLVLLCAVVATVWTWFLHDTWRQQRVQLTAQIVGVAGLLLLFWVLAFSRMSRTIRLGILGGFVTVLLLGAALFHVRGVTGDLLPILEWRWKSASAPPAMDPHLRIDTTTPSGWIGEGSNDYPQFLGPHRDTTLTGLSLSRDWTESPPELIWRQPVGAGWSAFSISGHHAVTQEQHADQEHVTAYDLHSGQRLWSHADTARYSTTIAGEGPRASPTIDGQRVYTLGATGLLNCLDLNTGERFWARNIVAENNSAIPEWGLAGSPLVLESLVIVSAGGPDGKSLVAYDKTTGAAVWSGGNDPAGYSSPRIANLAGQTQLLIFNRPGLAAHDPTTGQLLWDFPWAPRHPHVAMPVVVSDDRVLISSGYGSGSALLSVEQGPDGTWRVHEVWRSIRLKAKFTNVSQLGGFLYGLDDGIMVCLDLADGSRRWKDGRYGHGQQILVDDLLLVLTERGAVVLIEPVPEELRELGQFQALKSKTWNPPALAGNLLLVRNDQEAACYQLPLASSQPLNANR